MPAGDRDRQQRAAHPAQGRSSPSANWYGQDPRDFRALSSCASVEVRAVDQPKSIGALGLATRALASPAPRGRRESAWGQTLPSVEGQPPPECCGGGRRDQRVDDEPMP